MKEAYIVVVGSKLSVRYDVHAVSGAVHPWDFETDVESWTEPAVSDLPGGRLVTRRRATSAGRAAMAGRGNPVLVRNP